MRISGKKLFRNKAEAAGIGLFLLLGVLPLLLGVVYALLYSLGIAGLMSEGITLSHWVHVLTDSELWISLGFTFYIALVTIAISVAVSLALTLFLRRSLQRGLPAFALYVPLAFPAVVVAFLVFQIATQSGFLARLAYQLGWIAGTSSFPGLVNDPWGIGVIAAHCFMAIPFITLYFINLYDREQLGELRQVGQTLGATRTNQIRRIEIPILIRRASPTLILYTIFVLGSYEIPLLLGRQSPQMISVQIVRKLREFSLATIPEAYITALLFILIILATVTLLFNLFTIDYDLEQ